MIDGKSYMTKILALLVALALILGGFVYYLVKGWTGDFQPLFVEVEGGVNPGNGMTPDGPPEVEPPVSPPPTE